MDDNTRKKLERLEKRQRGFRIVLLIALCGTVLLTVLRVISLDAMCLLLGLELGGGLILNYFAQRAIEQTSPGDNGKQEQIRAVMGLLFGVLILFIVIYALITVLK